MTRGQLVRLATGEFVAIMSEGWILLPIGHADWPTRRVQSTLETVVVHEESGADDFLGFIPVRDEVRAALLHASGTGPNLSIRSTRVSFEADEDGAYNLDLELYSGPQMAASSLYVLGLEEEDRDLSRETLRDFETDVSIGLRSSDDDARARLVRELALAESRVDLEDFELTIAILAAIGAVAGAVVFASVVVVSVGLAAGATAAASITLIGTNVGLGALAGAAIGAAIGLLVAGITIGILEGQAPEPLWLSSFPLSGIDVSRALENRRVPPPVTTPEIVIDVYRLSTTRSFALDNSGNIFESLRYVVKTGFDNIFADYEVTIRHSVI